MILLKAAQVPGGQGGRGCDHFMAVCLHAVAEKDNQFINKTLLKNMIVENNVTIEMWLLDKNLRVNRKIVKHSFFYNGNTMVMKNSFTSYTVKIKKNVFVEEDPRKSCRNYPNAEFSSYAECDDQYMRDRIDKVAPGLNLTPPWLTSDLGEVTTEPVSVPIKVQLGNANFL